MKYLKIIPVNLFTLVSAFVGTYIALFLDMWFGLPNYTSPYATITGLTLIFYGLFFRLWASYTFYRNDLKVLGLQTQQKFTTDGPYQYSRNPLYVGIIAISFGFVIYAGSIIGLIGATLIPLFGWSLWVAYGEEKGLEQKFGDEYRIYKYSVPRWIGAKSLLPLLIAFVIASAVILFADALI